MTTVDRLRQGFLVSVVARDGTVSSMKVSGLDMHTTYKVSMEGPGWSQLHSVGGDKYGKSCRMCSQIMSQANSISYSSRLDSS